MSERPYEITREGVRLSWEEAMRVVPTIAAAEAERLAADHAEALTRNSNLRDQLRCAVNAKGAALVDFGEAIERLNREEYELARSYIKRGMNILQGKPRREGE